MANSRFGVALRACGLTLASLPTGRQLFFFLFGGGKIFKRWIACLSPADSSGFVRSTLSAWYASRPAHPSRFGARASSAYVTLRRIPLPALRTSFPLYGYIYDTSPGNARNSGLFTSTGFFLIITLKSAISQLRFYGGYY